MLQRIPRFFNATCKHARKQHPPFIEGMSGKRLILVCETIISSSRACGCVGFANVARSPLVGPCCEPEEHSCYSSATRIDAYFHSTHFCAFRCNRRVSSIP